MKAPIIERDVLVHDHAGRPYRAARITVETADGRRGMISIDESLIVAKGEQLIDEEIRSMVQR